MGHIFMIVTKRKWLPDHIGVYATPEEMKEALKVAKPFTTEVATYKFVGDMTGFSKLA